MALQDESLEYIRQQYDEKNTILAEFGEQVNPYTFYEDIFGDLELVLPVTVIGEEKDKKIRAMELQDAIEFASCRNDTLIGGCSYLNNWISKRSARDIYTFIIDFDNAYSGILLNALRNDWANDNGVQYAKPTYIVNSGTGLHLYFVLDQPVPCYHKQLQELDTLYRRLAKQQITRHYVGEQIQWFGQDFRMVGGQGKYGWENTAFLYGEKWDIDKLAAFYGMEGFHFIRNGEKRPPKKTTSKRKKPDKRNGFRTNRAFYDYSLENCRQKTKEGNRYMSMCALAVIAYKCAVPLDELERDLYLLLPIYNKDSVRKVKEKEIPSALKMYNEKAMQTPRESLERWIGWEYKPIKRNGRKRSLHLKLARANRDILCEERGQADWREGNGRKPTKKTVEDWQRQHPEGKPKDCIQDTGLSKNTVYKWWRKEGVSE